MLYHIPSLVNNNNQSAVHFVLSCFLSCFLPRLLRAYYGLPCCACPCHAYPLSVSRRPPIVPEPWRHTAFPTYLPIPMPLYRLLPPPPFSDPDVCVTAKPPAVVVHIGSHVVPASVAPPIVLWRCFHFFCTCPCHSIHLICPVLKEPFSSMLPLMSFVYCSLFFSACHATYRICTWFSCHTCPCHTSCRACPTPVALIAPVVPPVVPAPTRLATLSAPVAALWTLRLTSSSRRRRDGSWPQPQRPFTVHCCCHYQPAAETRHTPYR